MRPGWMLGGLVVGAVVGLAVHHLGGDAPAVGWVTAHVVEPIGALFLRLLFMLVLPLLISALALGIAGLGDVRRLGRIGIRTLAYTAVVSLIAVLLGVALVNLVRPGEGLSPELRESLARRASALPPAPASTATGTNFFVQLVPANVV